MIVAREVRLLIGRCIRVLHQHTSKKGNADGFPPSQVLIEKSIDKRAQGENTDWARAWRSFQPWGPY